MNEKCLSLNVRKENGEATAFILTKFLHFTTSFDHFYQSQFLSNTRCVLRGELR